MANEKARLVSEFFSNIGVAWFTAGVIGIFIGGTKNPGQILFSLAWGIFFSLLFLFMGSIFLKGAK